MNTSCVSRVTLSTASPEAKLNARPPVSASSRSTKALTSSMLAVAGSYSNKGSSPCLVNIRICCMFSFPPFFFPTLGVSQAFDAYKLPQRYDRLHEIGLRGHYAFDVLIRARTFVNNLRSFVAFDSLSSGCMLFQRYCFSRLPTAHAPSRAVRTTIKTVFGPES